MKKITLTDGWILEETLKENGATVVYIYEKDSGADNGFIYASKSGFSDNGKWEILMEVFGLKAKKEWLERWKNQ